MLKFIDVVGALLKDILLFAFEIINVDDDELKPII